MGAVLTAKLGQTNFFILMRTEPDSLSSQVSAFLNPDLLNGQKYTWNDNGDMIPALDEIGNPRERTGGKYHTRDANLKRPQNYQFSFGLETPQFGAFKFRFTGSGRWHDNRFTVRYDDETQKEFQTTKIDGNQVQLAHKNEQSYNSPTEAYARTLELMGDETYILTNAQKDDLWIGSEIQFITVDNKWWFVNLAAAGYWNFGAGPFGVFPDRNDPGIISEASADLNHQINEEGRIDQDRAFSINLLTGIQFWEKWQWSTALRYRDGQPFTRIDTVTGLPQGPTPVMNIWRGRVRHTFHMSADMRLQYRHRFAWLDNAQVQFALDVFNFFGSSTELLEDARDGNSYRTPLEMVPGRAIFGSITLNWDET